VALYDSDFFSAAIVAAREPSRYFPSHLQDNFYHLRIERLVLENFGGSFEL
jgi:hypothetical protein